MEKRRPGAGTATCRAASGTRGALQLRGCRVKTQAADGERREAQACPTKDRCPQGSYTETAGQNKTPTNHEEKNNPVKMRQETNRHFTKNTPVARRCTRSVVGREMPIETSASVRYESG